MMRRRNRVRPILQMEATECGAASLAMILAYYGKTVTLEELRRECGVSRNGVNAKSIVRVAQYHGLRPRAVRADPESVRTLKLPVIIHWNMDHFLVLCGFQKKGVRLADPACGLRTVSAEEFSRSFTGIAIELTPSENFRRDDRKRGEQSYIASCCKAFLPSIAWFLLLELCGSVAGAAGMFLHSVFVDKILIQGSARNLAALLGVLLWTGLLAAAVLALEEKLRHQLGKALNLQVNRGLIRHLLNLPVEFFAQRSAGDLANRQTSAMEMGARMSTLLTPLPGCVLQMLLYLALLLLFDVQIALIGVLCAVINATAMFLTARRREEDMRAYSRDLGALQGCISRSIDMIETLKSCGAEDAMFSRLAAEGTRAVNVKTEIDRTGVYSNSLFVFLNALGSGTVLIAGVWKILSGQLSIGVLVSVQSLVAAFLAPMGRTAGAGIELQTLRGEAARIDDIMHYQEDSKFLDREAGESRDMEGDIRFQDVSFSYSPLDPPFLREMSFTLRKGGCIAITGGSGSGKSTAAKLLAGLYQESGGAVTFGGAARKELDQGYFYSKVAVVSQNIRLFEGTVLDNITLWDESISYDDAVVAAKAACIHEDIIRRKDGYRELVTENGKNFSGGQRQRIEIARALAKRPSVIILDEATSALDADTEAQVMRNLKALGMTRIVVAHRLSTILDSDEIVVMAGGQIAERGTHEELMALEGAYYELVRSVG